MDKPEKTLPYQRFASDSLEDQAYRQIRRALVEGDFAPGQKMPIRRIASELGTSPMPVRTALRRLISEQALDVLPSGTAIVPRLTRSSFAKLGMVRAALEPLAVKMAASNLDRSTQERLAELLQKEQNARESGDPVQLLRADRQFLLALYEHCQTPMLLAMIEATWLRRGPHFWEARWLIIGRSPSGSKHADILRAVVSQDFDGAAQILKEEIEGTTSYLLERMSFADDQVTPGRLRPIRRK